MATKAQLDAIRRTIENDWTDDDYISAWNDYCNNSRYEDDMIFYMGAIDEIMTNSSVSDIMRMCYYGSVDPNDNYFEYDGYGNIQTFSIISESRNFDIAALVNYMAENGELGVEVDRDSLLSDFAKVYDLTDDYADDIVSASGCDLLTDDWDEIYSDGMNSLTETDE